MYYIYFPYVLLLSGLVLLECFRGKHPKWWSAAVLLAPITTPYFIFKSRKSEGAVLFMIFMTSFSAVAASEAFLYSRMKERTKYDHLSPMTRQVLRLSETLKLTTAELDMALVNLEKMSKVESRIKEVKKTIDFIGELRLIMARNQSSINRLIEFTTDYKSYFANKDLGWVYHVQLFYSDEKVVRHYNSLHVYLDDFEALLRYTHANFSYIADHKNEEHLKNYDEYYLRYRRAVDSHNKFNVQRIEFQNDFLIKYPGVKAYLPGERQTEAFRFWE